MEETQTVIFDLMRGSQAPISVFDDQDRLRFANDAFRATFDLAADAHPTWAEIMRSNWLGTRGTAITSADFEKWLTSAQSRRGKEPFRGFEADMQDGKWFWMTETVGPNGWMLCIAVDISTLACADRDLRYDRDLALRASRTDELTGIANRRQVMEKLDELISGNAGGCIAVFDLDHFKSINDTLGHAGGDAVLIDFARRVSGAVRRTDSFGRIGGEEFLFVLPQTPIEKALALLECLRQDLRARSPVPERPDFRYTFSVGITEVTPGDSTHAALSRADSACYQAKKTGRDRIVKA